MTREDTLAVPTIHLNGTSREELLSQICMALLAIEGAIAAVQKAYPHGRDYYPQGTNALRQAQSAHVARLAALGTVRDDLEQIGEAIANNMQHLA